MLGGVSVRFPTDLPTRLGRRGPLNVPDTAAFYGGDERGYTDYPEWADQRPCARPLDSATSGSLYFRVQGKWPVAEHPPLNVVFPVCK